MEKKRLRVLLVEDDPTDREAIKRFVTRQNLPYEIDSVESKKEFLLKLRQNKYDVILMDYNLPDSTGVDLLQVVGGTPVVMVTGSGDEKIAVESIRKGAYDYLVKDPERNYLELLPITVENVVARKKSETMLETERQKLFSILDELPGFVYLLKPDHSIAFFNRRFRKLFGDPQGKSCYEVIKKKKELCKKCPTSKVYDSKIPQEWEWTSSAGRTYQIYDYPFTDTDGSSLVLKLGMDITERKQAEEKLNKKTKFIQLVQEITVTANEAPTVEEAIQVCLDKVCNYMNWPVGHVYVTDSKGTLIPSKIWHIENTERFKVFRKVTEDTPFDLGAGLPGRVLATGKPAWISDVTNDQNFPRAKSAKDIGIKAAFGLPVLEGEKVAAVLEFFAEEAIEHDEPTLEALSNLAVQIGRVTERKRAEEELRNKTELLKLSQEITITANEAATAEGAMQICIDKICSFTKWPIGHVYITDSTGTLIPSKIWHVENAERFKVFWEITEGISFDRGVGLPGRVMATGKPYWVADVAKEPWFLRAKFKKDIGVRAGFAFPVLEGEKAVAVLEFFSDEAMEPDESMLEVLSNLAVQVGRVTERKHAEEILLENEKMLRQLSEAVFEGIVIAEKGEILKCSENFCSMFGYSLEELIGTSVLNLVKPEFRDIVSENIAKGYDGVYEVEALKKDGTEFSVEVHGVVAPYQGRIARVTAIRDITERKRAAEERKNMEEKFRQTQKLESLGILAGGIAHDFNNILTTILGNTELALDKLSPDSPLRNYIEEIEKGAKRAAELSQEMLAYSGKGKFVIKNIDVNELIKEITHMLKVSISKKHTIKYDLTENLPSVEVDITQIRQVIMNLIINGSEAIGQNIGVISIATGAMECDKDYLKKMYLHEELTGGLYNFIEVTDTGVGMDKDTIEKIFDPFFTTKFAGRGLGMSAVLGIIRGHKGAINIESKPGKGTKFTVFLPASREVSSTAKSGWEETTAPWRGSGTVLVVDDEETVRGVGKKMLEKMGFNVMTASDGQEAVEIFRDRSNEIDCVLLDFTMPRMNGEECFLELRKIRKDIRVIIYSGYSEEAIIQRFINQGINEFLQKPFSLKTLKNKMRKVFENN